MEQSFHEEIQKMWRNLGQDTVPASLNFERALGKKALDLNNVGNFYYYIFDRRTDTFRYISPEITTILGYPSEVFDLKFFLSKIHPDDQSNFLKNENRSIAFFKKLPNDKVTKYKVVHDYRIKDNFGAYIRVLQQVINVECDVQNNILMLMGVHTDITFLKKNNTSSLSFIGFDGEPTFTDIDLRQEFEIADNNFTKREREIINCLLAGDQTKEIATKLNISRFTVDTHRRNILSKTDTRNTLELAIKLMSEKLI